jgi:hypothetical protein
MKGERILILVLTVALLATLLWSVNEWGLRVLPFDPDNGVKDPVGTFSIPAPPNCSVICTRLFECGQASNQDECMEECGGYSLRTRRCLADADCAATAECFKQPDANECGSVCARLDQCQMADTDTCETECEEMDKAVRECIVQAACADIESDCLGFDRELACLEYCDHLLACNLDQEPTECFEDCLELSSGAIECALETSCDWIAPLCMDDGPDCRDFCVKLLECEQLAPIQFTACRGVCSDESEELVACVINVECEEINRCYQDPWFWPDCERYCDRLSDCDLIDPADETCPDLCRQEDPEIVWCVIDSECDQIESVCLGNPEAADCETVCGKLDQCGLPVPGCFDLCLFDWAEITIECIFGSDCGDIDPWCFEPDELICDSACEKMADCFAVEFGACKADCLEYWPTGRSECVIDAACVDVEPFCF